MPKKSFPFDSKDGFQTRVWGPAFWLVLHLIGLNYPMEPTTAQKKQYKKFFTYIQYILPCGACRDSYKNFITKNKGTVLTDDVMESRETVSKWLFDLHNAVNKKLCKPKKTGFMDTLSFYEQFRAACAKDKKGCRSSLYGKKRRTLIRVLPLEQCKRKRTMTCPKRKDLVSTSTFSSEH